MTHWMDQNNPNRDLSDPTWISAGAYHHEQKKRMDNFKRKQTENRKPTFKEAKDRIFIKSKHLGFDYKCTEHNHLSNDDDYMKLHLLKEHDLNYRLKNWRTCFTTFSVGDSYANDWRCNFCHAEFMNESKAEDHIQKHGIKFENQNRKELESVQDKKIKLWYSDDGENGIKFTILKFDPKLKCDECDIIGSWFMINEKYKIGACHDHCIVDQNIGDGKLWKKKEYTDSESLEGIN